MSLPTRYQPLAQYLAAQPPEVARVSLTLAEVEQLVGRPLAKSAFARSFWVSTANRVTPVVRRAGWQVVEVAVRSVPPAVTFGRLGTVPNPTGGRSGRFNVQRRAQPETI